MPITLHSSKKTRGSPLASTLNSRIPCEDEANLMLILLIILLILALGAFPAWPYSRSWGYYPSGGLGLILLIVLLVMLLNHGF